MLIIIYIVTHSVTKNVPRVPLLVVSRVSVIRVFHVKKKEDSD